MLTQPCFWPASKLGILRFGCILFRRISVFGFGILQLLFSSELLGMLLSSAYHNSGQEERLVFLGNPDLWSSSGTPQPQLIQWCQNNRSTT